MGLKRSFHASFCGRKMPVWRLRERTINFVAQRAWNALFYASGYVKLLFYAFYALYAFYAYYIIFIFCGLKTVPKVSAKSVTRRALHSPGYSLSLLPPNRLDRWFSPPTLQTAGLEHLPDALFITLDAREDRSVCRKYRERESRRSSAVMISQVGGLVVINGLFRRAGKLRGGASQRPAWLVGIISEW